MLHVLLLFSMFGFCSFTIYFEAIVCLCACAHRDLVLKGAETWAYAAYVNTQIICRKIRIKLLFRWTVPTTPILLH